MVAIVAAAENNGIGKEGKLLWSLPSDMRRFRRLTEGKTVVMGRKTLQSLPGGRPLPRRRNIVLSRRSAPVEGVELARSVEEAMALTKEDGEVFVIGGAEVYRALLPYCTRVELTRVYDTPEADVFFPALAPEEWTLAAAAEPLEENGVRFRYETYIRR